MTYSDLAEFVNGWGFCPHPHDNESEGMCDTCYNDASQRSFSWEEASTLTHERQVAVFGWCACEDSEPTYEDCPS